LEVRSGEGKGKTKQKEDPDKRVGFYLTYLLRERKKERRPANKLNQVDHASLEEGERDTHEKLVDYYYRHRVL
jgi:hypothetical protein